LPPGAALSPVWNAADDVLYFVTAATVQAYRVSGGALVKLNNVATAAGTTILAYNGVSELFVTNYITTGTSSAYAAQIANDGSIGSISTATTNDALQVKSAVYLSRNLAMVIAGAKGALFFDTSSGKPAAVTNIKFSGMDYYSCDDMCPTYAVAALLSASSDFIDIADISKPTEAIPIINRIMLPADYGATYGISFSPDGERIAFFHALITLTQGKSVMTIIRNN
jgi:hypothetical protein